MNIAVSIILVMVMVLTSLWMRAAYIRAWKPLAQNFQFRGDYTWALFVDTVKIKNFLFRDVAIDIREEGLFLQIPKQPWCKALLVPWSAIQVNESTNPRSTIIHIGRIPIELSQYIFKEVKPKIVSIQ